MKKKFFPRIGITGQKILLLLLSGAALAFTRSPAGYRRILRAAAREWRDLNRKELYYAIRRLYESKLVHYKQNDDGTVTLALNRDGRRVALRYKLDEMSIPKPDQWDYRWRVVLFDIPEKKRRLRDTLRMRLRQLGLIELQKSVFVHPYECRNEIDFIIELYDARRYVRFIEAVHIDTESHLKLKFRLA